MGLEVLVIKFEAKDQGVVFREIRRWVEDGGVRGFTYVRVGECVVVGGDEFDPEDAVGWRRGVRGGMYVCGCLRRGRVAMGGVS